VTEGPDVTERTGLTEAIEAIGAPGAAALG
jgi:hypothetical protein